MYENPTIDRLTAIQSVDYAHFAAVGTWIARRNPCNACGWHWQEYGPPLQVQWEPSSRAIGDFSWDGPFGYLFIATQRVVDYFREMHIDCDFFPVKYVEPERKSVGKCVSYPYDGPSLMWGLCRSFVKLDTISSNVVLTSSCPECGDSRYTFRNKGIIIRENDWGGERMFRIISNGNSKATFVTEEGRELIQRGGFTNVTFSEAGFIIN